MIFFRIVATLVLFTSVAFAENPNKCAPMFWPSKDDSMIIDFANHRKLQLLDRDLQNIQYKAQFDNFNVLQTIFPNAQVKLSSDNENAGVLQGNLKVRIISGKLRFFQVIDSYEIELHYPSLGREFEIESNSIDQENESFDTHIIKFDMTHEDTGFVLLTLGAQDIIQAEVRAGDGNTYVVFFAYGLPPTTH